MGLEEVEEKAAGAAVEVFQETGAGAGSDLGARLGHRRPAFVPVAEQLYLIGENCLAFKPNALIVVRL